MAAASRPFQVFAKPGGGVCNLACHYCYYLKAQHLHPDGSSPRMPDDLLEQYIAQHIDASPDRTVNFSWHGGEPTVLGLDYFRKIAALERAHLGAGRRVSNGIQTNGILIDEDWCDFLRSERFTVGLSLDGPADLHDDYRVTRGRNPSHRQVMRAFTLLRKYKIPTDVLCVVHDRNVEHPKRVYGFFKDIGARSIGFLPVVEPASGGDRRVSPETVPAESFGAFLCTIFDEWVRRDVGRIVVQMFEEAARPARRLDHSLCIFRETCGDVPVVEHNGDFYSCDHYVDPRHRVGNIRETPLADLLESQAQRAFGWAKRDGLPRACRMCEVRAMCNGGCPKDRFVTTADGEEGLNYLCAAFKRFFAHALPYTLQLALLERAHEPPEHLMQSVASADVRLSSGAGRNDPCPCGSGLKYKKCCLGR